MTRDRAALLFGAALALGACNAGVPAPAYGGPPPPDTVTAIDAATSPVAVSAYGAPAPTSMLDGPTVDAGAPPAPVAAYGAPPTMMDAGAPKPKKK